MQLWRGGVICGSPKQCHTLYHMDGSVADLMMSTLEIGGFYGSRVIVTVMMMMMILMPALISVESVSNQKL